MNHEEFSMDLTAQDKSSQIAEYSATEAALADLSARYRGMVFDVTDTKGMDEAKKGRAEVRGYRTALESKRKEIKAPALERCALIDAEAKRITAELIALEDPIDKQIKKEEERKEAEKAAKAEAERLALVQIMTRLANIRNIPLLAAASTSDTVMDDIERLEALEIDDSFKTYYGEAAEAKATSLQKLREIYAAKVRAEAEAIRVKQEQDEQMARMRAEREDLARRKAEQDAIEAQAKAERDAEFKRLQAIRDEIAAAQLLMAAEAAKKAKVEEDQRKEQERIEADRIAEEKRVADQKAADELHKRALAQQASMTTQQGTGADKLLTPDFTVVENNFSKLYQQIDDLKPQLNASELGLTIHYMLRLLDQRQAAA